MVSDSDLKSVELDQSENAEAIHLEQEYLDQGISGFTLSGTKIGYLDIQNHNRRQLRIPASHDVVGLKCNLDKWSGDI